MAVLAIAGAVARAQDLQGQMDACVQMRRDGLDLQAVECFRAAHESGGGTVALAQLALAEQAAGLWLDAAAHLETALADAEDEWIARNRATLDEALATIRTHLGTLEIEGDAPGARLTIDGREIGRLPLAEPIRVEAGSMIVQAEAEGRYPVQRQVTVAAGQLARVQLVFVPQHELAPERQPDLAPPAIAPGTDPGLLAGAVVSYAATGLALVSFVIALIVREIFVQTYNRCDPFTPGGGRDAACPSEHATWRTAEDWAIATGIATGVGASAAAGFTIALVLSPTQAF